MTSFLRLGFLTIIICFYQLYKVMVDNTDMIYDNVRFIEPCTKSLAIANTGQVPVTFEFISKPGEPSYARPWLSAEPSSGFIMPGEKADVVMEVYVDKKTAHALNCGEDKLYDILVLHLMGGKDIFITVTISTNEYINNNIVTNR